MILKVLLPNKVLVEEEAVKVVGEAVDGSFCVLPRHVNFVSALTPGILSYLPSGGEEIFMAVDEGVFIKIDDRAIVSVKNAIIGEDLDRLKETVRMRFKKIDEREKMARSALARLEAGAIRRFMELGKTAYE